MERYEHRGTLDSVIGLLLDVCCCRTYYRNFLAQERQEDWWTRTNRSPLCCSDDGEKGPDSLLFFSGSFLHDAYCDQFSFFPPLICMYFVHMFTSLCTDFEN